MTELRLFIVLTSFVSILGLYWLATDPRSAKERKADFKDRDTMLRRLFQYGLLALQTFLSLHVYKTRFIYFDAFTIIGLLLLVSGLALSVWAKAIMNHSWGLPATLNIVRQKSLVINGPFNYTRNPIYVGLLLTGTGYFLMLRSPLLITMLPVFIYFYVSVAHEEKLLLKAFGKKYEKYLRETPRFLFI